MGRVITCVHNNGLLQRQYSGGCSQRSGAHDDIGSVSSSTKVETVEFATAHPDEKICTLSNKGKGFFHEILRGLQHYATKHGKAAMFDPVT